MKFLVDTNILLRLVQKQSSQHLIAVNAVRQLLLRGDKLSITLQNASEFGNVCTRPAGVNGLGLAVAEVDLELTAIEGIFELLPDNEDVYKNWRQLVVDYLVSGIKVHDAKIVAAMKAHGLKFLLTFNDKDFRRFADIVAVTPGQI